MPRDYFLQFSGLSEQYLPHPARFIEGSKSYLYAEKVFTIIFWFDVMSNAGHGRHEWLSVRFFSGAMMSNAANVNTGTHDYSCLSLYRTHRCPGELFGISGGSVQKNDLATVTKPCQVHKSGFTSFCKVFTHHLHAGRFLIWIIS